MALRVAVRGRGGREGRGLEDIFERILVPYHLLRCPNHLGATGRHAGRGLTSMNHVCVQPRTREHGVRALAVRAEAC